MIESEIRTIRYENGEMQRYQIVRGFEWTDLEFCRPEFTKPSFDEICRMYTVFTIPKHRDLYGAVVLFHIPDGMEMPFPYESDDGIMFNSTIAFSSLLNKMKREGRIRRRDNGIESDDNRVNEFLKQLEDESWLYIACGDLDDVSFVPFGDYLGYLSEGKETPQLAFNSHFFEMDMFDNDSPYDILGLPYGLMMEKGIIYQPPLNGREAFAVDKSGRSHIIRPSVSELGIEIQGKLFRDGVNCRIYKRPEERVTDAEEGLDVIIEGRAVTSYHRGGGVRIPMGGFVLHTKETLEEVECSITYHGLDEYQFALQVGPCAVEDYRPAMHFEKPFYDIYKDPIPYPPTLYPLDYEKDRAPRMVLAADKDDKPLVIWAEGCSKLGYRRGEESAGASLLEIAEYCHELGVKNAVNLDGGGSAEIFIDGRIEMKVSARLLDGTPSERPIPLGLIVR